MIECCTSNQSRGIVLREKSFTDSTIRQQDKPGFESNAKNENEIIVNQYHVLDEKLSFTKLKYNFIFILLLSTNPEPRLA